MILQEKLIPYIEAARSKPFAWSTWDCCQFVGGWIAELTGVDPRNVFPSYSDESSARAILTESGGLAAMVSSVLTEIHPSAAHEGDIILSNDETGTALGICLGVRSAHVGVNGIEFLYTLDALKAWRVQELEPASWQVE